MATIDDKVVAASFESSKFEQGVSKTIGSIDKLKKALTFPNAGKGFDEIEKSAQNVDLSHIGKSVDAIKSKFSAFNAVATATLFRLTNIAINTGAQMVKSLTIAPVMEGFHNYETQINAVQTILANTGLTGKKGLEQVNGALKDLNEYANKTVYNFSEMAKNIGTFTAAGVDLKTATGSIKGIANLAALSGSNSQQASTAMYQLSQAIAAGRVNLQDWNSVVNAGMGGKVFQSALANTAQAMGKLKDGSVKLIGPMKQLTINGETFRNSISTKGGGPSWLTSDVLTKTLQHFTGDMTDAQLAAQGFNKEQIKAIQAQAKTAVGAATNIKTISQMMQALKEEVASAWSSVFKTLFGDINGATKMFTALHNALQNALTNPIYAFNKVLESWAKLGGRKLFIHSLIVGFNDLKAVIEPLKQAFREFFPAKTGKDLLATTQEFHHLVSVLSPTKKTIDNLHRTFRGLFAALDIGKQIVSGIFSVIKTLVGQVGKSSGGVLNFTGNVGDLVVKLDEWLKRGDRLKGVFDKIGSALQVPISMISNFANAIINLISGTDKISGVGDAFNSVGQALTPSQKAIEGATKAWQGLLDVLKNIYQAVQPILSAIGQAFSQIGSVIADAIKHQNFDNVFSVIQTGLIAGIFLEIKKALTGGINFDFGGKALKNVTSSLDVLKGSLASMQQTIRAATLLEIATAVGVLTASVVALTFVDPKRLSSSLTAITVGLAQLIGAMALLQKAGGSGIARMPAIAASMILMATAIDTLTVAIVILSKLSWEGLAKGLAGVLGAVVALSVAVEPLSAAGPGMIIASASMIALGVAINILAGAVKIFSTMSWGDMAKGLVGVSVALDAVALSARALPSNLPLTGAGLILVGVGLNAIAAAVKIFGSMKWEDMGKGLAGMAGSLVAIAVAMQAMPPTLPLTAAGLILVGIALTGIAGAIALMGQMNVSTLAKGIIGIGAALLALAAGLTAMIASLPGAAALVLAAAGLAVLVPLIGIMAGMKWSTIAKGVGGMVAAIVALSVAGAVAAPGLIAMGAALVVLGAGLAVTGAGAYLLASALSKLGGEGGKGVGIAIAALTAFVAVLPKIIIDFLKGLVEILAAIAKIAPQVVDSLVKIAESLVQVIIRVAPKMAVAAVALITAILTVLNRKAGDIIQAGWKLLLNLLKGINDHIVDATKLMATIVVKMINTLATKAGSLITAGYNMLVAILKGIGNNISRVIAAGVNIVAKLVLGIINNVGRVVKAIATIIGKIISTITGAARQFISAGTKIIANVVVGIGNAASAIVTAAIHSATKFITTLASQIPKEVDRVATAIIRMLNALADVIRRREPEFIGAMGNIGEAIVSGIVKGMDGLGKKILNKIKDEVLSLPGKGVKLVQKAIGKVSVVGGVGGFDIGEDLAKGMMNSLPKVRDSANRVVAEMSKATKGIQRLGAEQQAILQGYDNVPRGTPLHEFLLGVSGWIERNDAVDQAFANLNDKFAGSISDTQQKIKDNKKNIGDAVKGMAQANQKITDINAKIGEDVKKANKAAKAKDTSGYKQAMKDYNADVAERKKVIKQSTKDYAKNKQAYDKYNDILNQNTDLLYVLKNAQKSLNTEFGAQQDTLHQAIVDLEAYSKAADEAKQHLDDLKQQQEDYAKSTADQFASLPDLVLTDKNGRPLSGDKQVAAYEKQLAAQAAATDRFKATLDQLRALGLDDKTYQKLISEGTADQAFADALVGGGKSAVDNLNSLDSNLTNSAQALGADVSHSLYDAGIQAAQGLLDGLNAKKNEIAQTMADIANEMVTTLRTKLHIKSPSEVFAELGRYSALGIAKGLEDSSKNVTDAVYGITDDALTALKSGMTGISDAVAKYIDPNPTITPVLDLSQIHAGAASIGGILGGSIASTSFASAASISPNMSAQVDVAKQPNDAVIKFEQNNYSPESLSAIEIFRQTRNQLSQAKAALSP